jgi:hypothetical protein
MADSEGYSLVSYLLPAAAMVAGLIWIAFLARSSPNDPKLISDALAEHDLAFQKARRSRPRISDRFSAPLSMSTNARIYEVTAKNRTHESIIILRVAIDPINPNKRVIVISGLKDVKASARA